MLQINGSTRQQSSRKRFTRWIKKVLRNPAVYQWSMFGLRVIDVLRQFWS